MHRSIVFILIIIHKAIALDNGLARTPPMVRPCSHINLLRSRECPLMKM